MSAIRLTALLTLSACVTYADDPPRPSDQPTETVAALAGDYYWGDGLGFNCRLVIAPAGRFSYTWRGCLGLCSQNKGAAKLVDGRSILKPEEPGEMPIFPGTATDLIPVRWGNRLYLIAQDQKARFCNAINQGDEPRKSIRGFFYVRHSHDGQINATSGKPGVPEDWEPLLLKKPLDSKVLKVLEDGRATLDCGTDAGVWKGMELSVEIPSFGEPEFVRAEVVEVDPKTCVVRRIFGRESIEFKAGLAVHSRLK
jgi:hypothetical protein